MIIVGIDPGIRRTGFGVIKKNGKLLDKSGNWKRRDKFGNEKNKEER